MAGEYNPANLGLTGFDLKIEDSKTCRVGTNSLKMMQEIKWQHSCKNGSLSCGLYVQHIKSG